MELSIFRIEKKKEWTKIYFQSIEEMYELYVHLRKKNPRLEIDVLKETKDRRVSSIEGKYYDKLPEKIKIGKYNYFRIKNRTRHKDIGLRTYGIKRYKEDYYYIPRKEFDKRRDSWYSLIDMDDILCLDSKTMEQQFYELRLRHFRYPGRFKSSNVIGMHYNSEEELYHVYLYFLKKGYHIKITTNPDFVDKHEKLQSVKRIWWNNINECYWWSQNIYETTLNLNENYRYFLKFIEDLKNLYNEFQYTFEVYNYPCASRCNTPSPRFHFHWQRNHLLEEKNELICYHYGSKD